MKRIWRKSHRVWFQAHGYLPDWKNKREIIHHIDGDKRNNDISNLALMTTGEHSALHRRTGTPWNKGKRGLYKKEHLQKIADANRKRIWKQSSKDKISKFASQRTDLKRNEKGKYYVS